MLAKVRRRSLAAAVDGERERPHTAANEVAEHVAAPQRGNRVTPVDVTAGDGAARAVVVLEDRICQRFERRRQRVVVGTGAFAVPPAVVAATTAGWLVVDLLDDVLADIGNEERTSAAARWIVERNAPGIAQPQRPDFWRSTPDERIVSRDIEPFRVAIVDVDVDPQNLAVQHRQILCLVRRIVGFAAVAGADVEVTVGPEYEVAAVVKRKRMSDKALTR